MCNYSLNIGDHDLKDSVFVIAEIGSNHEGNFALAKQLIELAKINGADAVKFQSYQSDKLVAVSEYQRRDHFRRLQFREDQFKALSEYANELGIMFLSTPFDVDSVDMLDRLNVPAFKVSSGDFTCKPLLKHIALKNKPMILSTGLSTMDEIKHIQDYIISVNPKLINKLVFLHCVTSYPTPAKDANIGMVKRMIEALPETYIGYSDHCMDTIQSCIAVCWGARVIEKHFTIDKEYSDFRDHQLSADPMELKRMIAQIRIIEEYSKMTNEVSVPEKSNSVLFQRSLAAKCDIGKYEELTEENVTFLRPGTGIPSHLFDKYIGKYVNVNIKAGEIIMEDFIV